MNEKTKSILWKLLWFLLTFILIEVLVLLAISTINVLSEYKLDISVDLLLSEFKQVFTHLPSTLTMYWQEKNPLFILGTIFSLVYSLVIHKGNFKKTGWETETENAYHGSAHWAKPFEVFDKKNFLKATKKEIQNDFLKSLEE